ncbi:hypothetical protein [Tenacibaculum maritimum]|uniref:hypothetical protein n=1 Tax=Tenacibaculum maritimum TaxID=107401 RepID=UPI003891145D
MKKQLTILFLACSFHTLFAQEHSNEHRAENIKEPGWEIVLSGLSIYTPKHEIWNPAIEAHLTYWNYHKWAYGIGYSAIFESHETIGHEIAGLVSHKPWSFLTLNFGPSIGLPNTHKDTEISAYLESEFAFHIGQLHLGPTVGSLISKEFKFFGGWHFSYEF